MNNVMFNFKKIDAIYIFLILLFSVFTIYEMIGYYMVGGISDPDKAIYLIDALKFAGMDYYNVCLPQDIYYSPVICFLTSIVFRFGLIDRLAIYIVTGVFGVLGELGLYFYFRNKFDPLLSFMGVIIFGSLSVVLLNIGSGGIDIPSIAISIWLLIFTVIAINKNSKYFLIIGPLFILGFFTRYTIVLLLPAILIYYLLDKDIFGKINLLLDDKNKFKTYLVNYLRSSEFKYILISFILGVILFTIISLFILYHGGFLTFFEQSTNTINGIQFSSLGPDANNSRLYYLKNLFSILFWKDRVAPLLFSIFLLIILVIGNFINILYNLKNIEIFNLPFNNKMKFIFHFINIVSICLIIIGFVIIRNHLLTNLGMFILMISFYYTINNNNDFNLKFLILNLSWLLISFIFASLYNTKVPRYFIPMVVPFVFFIVLGLEKLLMELSNFLNVSVAINKNILSFDNKIKFVPFIIILILVIATCIYLIPLPDRVGHHTALTDVTDYIAENDPDYHFKEIISYDHYFMIIKWHLKINGTKLRPFETDSIDQMNATYVIIDHDYDFKNYHKIYHSKEMQLFIHN